MAALAGQAGQWGPKRHQGQRASGFINFLSGGNGLFKSAQLVLSIVRPPFLVAASIPCRALLPAAWCMPGDGASLPTAPAPAPAAAALPGEGPSPAGTGSVPSRLCRDVVPLHSIRVFQSCFIYRRRYRKGEDEGFWWPWAGGCLLRHSPVPQCLFLFNILPFCVYFAGVYFGKGSVYISVFTQGAHMVIFALPGRSIPPPPLPPSPRSS